MKTNRNVESRSCVKEIGRKGAWLIASSLLLGSIVGCSDEPKRWDPNDITTFQFWEQPAEEMLFTSDFESVNNSFSVLNMPTGSTTSISGDTGDAVVIFTPSSSMVEGNMTTMNVELLVTSPDSITEDLIFTDMVIAVTDSLQTIESRSFAIVVAASED